ncbi:MAG: chromosome segregation protein, partial [Verrucomicrobia bacterium]|nr:chromosome segregation protein [Verrucomicrobiota bacterium]
MQLSRLITWLCSLAYLGSLTIPTAAAERIRFNRDIRPILSDHCYACHGPDQKALKASLRLDLKRGLFEPLKSGEVAVVPGRPDESELLRRILHDDEDEVMPPKKGGKPL